MFKKVIPYVLAIFVFIIALILLWPAPSKMVVLAAHDLSAGHTLVAGDLYLQPMPASAVASDALTDTKLAVGQTLKIDRGQGDILRTSNLGEMITLQPDERAVAVKVTDETGLVGLLAPGEKIGIVASIPMQSQDTQGTFSKATIEGLRVLYLDPRFAASTNSSLSSASMQPVSNSTSLTGTGNASAATDRAETGFVVLAVPTGLQTVMYDFSADNSVSETRSVNVLELLAALSSTNGAEISLYLMPGESAKSFSSPGLWLPNLVVTPEASVTPTPTGLPGATLAGTTPSATPKP
jgi:pilus assembly protein CpaB